MTKGTCDEAPFLTLAARYAAGDDVLTTTLWLRP